MAGSGRRLRVYVVEDSVKLLTRLLELLEGAGAEIVGHSDAAETAIREIVANGPEVVIVDIALRRGNGFDVLRSLQSHSNGRRPVAIVLSNYTDHPYRAAAREFGVEYYFDKSKEVFAMLQLVSKMVRDVSLRNGSHH